MNEPSRNGFSNLIRVGQVSLYFAFECSTMSFLVFGPFGIYDERMLSTGESNTKRRQCSIPLGPNSIVITKTQHCVTPNTVSAISQSASSINSNRKLYSLSLVLLPLIPKLHPSLFELFTGHPVTVVGNHNLLTDLDWISICTVVAPASHAFATSSSERIVRISRITLSVSDPNLHRVSFFDSFTLGFFFDSLSLSGRGAGGAGALFACVSYQIVVVTQGGVIFPPPQTGGVLPLVFRDTLPLPRSNYASST